MYLTVVFSYILLHSFAWFSGDILCPITSYCFRMSVILTAYSIAVLSFQRYRVTVYPLQVWVSSQPTWRATGATICGLWIVAALFTIPSARTHNLCVPSAYLWLTNYYQRVAIFVLLVSCVLPLCVIAFCYVMMTYHLLKSRFSLTETNNSRQNTRNNTANVVLGLTLVFLFTSVPFNILEQYVISSINLENTYEEIFEEVYGSRDMIFIDPILYILLSLNSCLNPVALFCTSLAFRRHLKHYLTRCCKKNSPPTDFELTRRN
jgi:hypothetical protein